MSKFTGKNAKFKFEKGYVYEFTGLSSIHDSVTFDIKKTPLKTDVEKVLVKIRESIHPPKPNQFQFKAKDAAEAMKMFLGSKK